MRFFKRINRYLTFVMILWAVSVGFIVASFINHPQIKLEGKENLPDYYFTVDTDIIGEPVLSIYSFSYEEYWGFGGVTYKLEAIDLDTYKLVFTYSERDSKEFAGLVDVTMFLRRQSAYRYKSFIILRKSLGDLIPNPINYYTNISVDSFNNYMPPLRGNIGRIVRFKYNKLNVKKVIIDAQKDIKSLTFFRSIKLVLG